VETIKARLVEDLLPDDPKGSEAKRLLGAASGYAAALRADGTCPDVDYANRTSSAWKTPRHLSRVCELAKARRLAGGEALKPKALAALDHWLAKDYKNSNWWWNQIGVPRKMGEILLLLEPDLAAAQKTKGLEILKRAKIGMTGQNRVWVSGISLARACLERDADLAAKAIDSIAGTIRTTTAEGIQPDWSFHQHGACLYAGGYGLGFSLDCARFAYYAHGTGLAFSEEKLKVLSAYILDGQVWMVRGDCFDYGATGREIARKGIDHKGRAVAAACRYMAKIPGSRQAEFAATAERLNSAKVGVKGEPSGNRYFWRSAFLVHRRPGYYVSVRMARRDLCASDGTHNKEGLRSHYLSDGVTYIFRTGTEYERIFGAWDWRRPPGITGRAAAPFAGSTKAKGARAFAGAASDGTVGVAAMDWANAARGKGYPAGQLAARKAWFCFEREVVCLGAGITCTGASPVITSVNQCLLRGEVATSEGVKEPGAYDLAGPAWVHHDSVGYVFPEKAKLYLAPGPQTGSWRSINGRYPAEKETRDVFNLWLDHGTKPQAASYVYHIVPGIETKDLPAYAKASGVEVLANTPALQAVRHKALRITGAAFYEPGAIEMDGRPFIAVDQSCIVLVRRLAGGKLRVAVCKPNADAKRPKSVTVTVSGRRGKFELPTGSHSGESVMREL